MKEVVVIDGARTPFAEFCGSLKEIIANDLGAIAARGAMERSGIKPGQINHVIFGNAMQTSGDALYGARHVALKSGVPIDVPAITVNRICGSGLQARKTFRFAICTRSFRWCRWNPIGSPIDGKANGLAPIRDRLSKFTVTIKRGFTTKGPC